MIFEATHYDLYYYKEDKPLMVMLPGADDPYNPLEESIKEGKISPEINIIFFRRAEPWERIPAEEVKAAINSIPRTEVYYAGFSLGAWDFNRYKDIADFTKVILIDGYCVDFWDKPGISDIYVMQAYENYIYQYEAMEYLTDADITIFDWRNELTHWESYTYTWDINGLNLLKEVQDE